MVQHPLVYKIIIGSGEHTPQYDQQLRLVEASHSGEAFEKGRSMGYAYEDNFSNTEGETVRWQFLDISEIRELGELSDGQEIFSRIEEPETDSQYERFVIAKGRQLKESHSYYEKTAS